MTLRPEFTSITDLGLQSGLAKGTLTNRLLAAEKLGEEPVFDMPTIRAVAGRARISLSWLEGISADEKGIDIPPPPAVTPTEIARRRAGGGGSEIERLRAEVRELRRLVKQGEKR